MSLLRFFLPRVVSSCILFFIAWLYFKNWLFHLLELIFEGTRASFLPLLLLPLVGSLCRLPRGSVGIFFVTSDV
jgi:hypothetical protein